MKEIWIPESIMVVFFALPLLRPLVKAFWNVDGLVWLFLLGLGIAAGIFPAYGFRPECLPLLVFALVLNFLHIPSFIASAVSRSSDDFHERGIAFTGISLALLAAAAWVMFTFSPAASGELTVEGVEMKTLRDNVRKQDFFLRVYNDVSGGERSGAPGGAPGGALGGARGGNAVRPVIFLVPPEAGSVQAVDLLCAALRDRGFTVVTYSRRGFDFPALGEKGRTHPVSLARLYSFWRAFRAGTQLAEANRQGKAIEAERQNDIEFLLPRVLALWGNTGRLSGAPFIFAGFGAGGSTLLTLSEDADFAARYRSAKGIVAIESRLWSAYRSAPPASWEIPPKAGRFQIWRENIAARFRALKPEQTGGLADLPKPGLPVLYLISDNALHDRKRQLPYQAVLKIQRTYSPVPSALAALAGAGPLDYCDFSLTFPVYSFFFPGWKYEEKNKNPVEDTASLIGNFSLMLLERESSGASGEAPPPFTPNIILPEKRRVGGKVYIENRGLPEF